MILNNFKFDSSFTLGSTLTLDNTLTLDTFLKSTFEDFGIIPYFVLFMRGFLLLQVLTPDAVLSTLSGYYGGQYVSNFNRFSKVYTEERDD